MPEELPTSTPPQETPTSPAVTPVNVTLKVGARGKTEDPRE